MSNTAKEVQDLDLSVLLKEAGEIVDTLIKSEKERLESLSKSEEKKEEPMKKDESPMEEKEESSGYESQAPEASQSQSQPEQSQPAPEQQAAPEQDPGEQQLDSLEDMVSSLDEDMLRELKQVVDMELSARQNKEAPGLEPQSEQSQPAPEQQSQPEMQPDMAMKSEVEALKDKLAKSEEKANNVEKAFGLMSEVLEKMINRPIDKAITDIQSVKFVDKGETQLKKSETDLTDADIKKRAEEMSRDPKKLSALTKNERDSLMDFLVSKKKNPEILKIVTK